MDIRRCQTGVSDWCDIEEQRVLCVIRKAIDRVYFGVIEVGHVLYGRRVRPRVLPVDIKAAPYAIFFKANGRYNLVLVSAGWN